MFFTCALHLFGCQRLMLGHMLCFFELAQVVAWSMHDNSFNFWYSFYARSDFKFFNLLKDGYVP
jgi:hypothetical protein